MIRSLAVLTLLALLALSPWAFAMHLDWMTPYKDADGQSCCNDADCRPADVVIESESEGRVEIDGERLTINPKTIFRIPPGGEMPIVVTGYWCWRMQGPKVVTQSNHRCVFWRGGIN
jgi:hypothetical protein